MTGHRQHLTHVSRALTRCVPLSIVWRAKLIAASFSVLGALRPLLCTLSFLGTMAWHELSAFMTVPELSGFCSGAQVAHITCTYNFNVFWGGALGWASIRCCEQQQKHLVHRGWNSDNMVVADQGSPRMWQILMIPMHENSRPFLRVLAVKYACRNHDMK